MAEPRKGASSETSSEGSSTSPYTHDQGPGYDPNKAVPQRPTDEKDVESFQESWEEEQVRSWLLNAGALAHAGFGVAERDWTFTKADLERIAPPATRILNRYQPSRAAAAYSDPAAVAIGMGMYGWRSTLERVDALKRQKLEEEAGPGANPIETTGPIVSAPDPGGEPGAQVTFDEPGETLADQLRATRIQEDETG